MRLTLVISQLWGGGAERVMSVLASSWAEQGKEVSVLTFDREDAPRYPIHPSVKVRGLGLLAPSRHFFHGLLQNVRRIRVLRRAIRESQPDLVISFMDCTNVLTLFSTRGLETPIIVAEHCGPSGYEIGPVWNTLRQRVYPRAHALVCLTNATLARFRETMRVRGHVIPNSVSVPPAVARYNNAPGGRSTGRVLIAMGRLVPEKGFDLLLNAFQRVAGRHPDWSVTILGDGPLKETLAKQAETLGLADRVRFPGWFEDPFSILSAADLFVLSSRFEGFPLALCEAMACGLPVVSFDCPSGPRDIIRDGADGILVPPQDAAALAAALDRLMGDPEERQRLASRAPEVVTRFSRDRALSLWENLFQDLLGGCQEVNESAQRVK